MNLDSEELEGLGRDLNVIEQIFDRLPDVLFYIKDEEARYVIVNQAVVLQSGAKDKKEVYGKTADELFPVSGYSTLEQDLEVISSGKPLIDLLRLYFSADGKRQWCLSSKFPFMNGYGLGKGLIGVSRRLPRPDEKHLNYKRLVDFLKVFEVEGASRLLVSEVASQVGLSIDILEKMTKEVFQLTPKQLILQMRINRACELLETTELSITDIAAECGYSDHSAFSRHFKVATHFTPKEFRIAKSLA
ncbi:helix-turn-helix domain-containing protein [Pseudomonas aeruginosa]|nr:helix-turn-helix domain-containing protein [Pseudomonas aeruginosa]